MAAGTGRMSQSECLAGHCHPTLLTEQTQSKGFDVQKKEFLDRRSRQLELHKVEERKGLKVSVGPQ